MHQLDAFLGDIFNDIVDKEEKIARELADLIVQRAPCMLAR
jgi:hypothetical protein